MTKSGCARLERPARVGRVLVHRQDDDREARIVPLEARNGFQAIHVRHRDVDYDCIRSEPSRGRDEFPPVLDDPDELEIVDQKPLQPLGEHDVVVSDQHPRLVHGTTLRAGWRRQRRFPARMPHRSDIPHRQVPPAAACWQAQASMLPGGCRRNRSRHRTPQGGCGGPAPRISTSTPVAWACRAAFRSASCVTRYRQSAASAGTSSGTSRLTKETGIEWVREKASHSIARASCSPRSRSSDGCRR